MGEKRTTVRVPRQGINPEQNRDLRARALRFVFDCYAKKKSGVFGTAPNDAEGKVGDGFHADKTSIRR